MIIWISHPTYTQIFNHVFEGTQTLNTHLLRKWRHVFSIGFRFINIYFIDISQLIFEINVNYDR